jgi:hypothetical protein
MWSRTPRWSRTASTSTSTSAAAAGQARTGRSRSRPERVDAEARRLADLGATHTGVLGADGLDHYAVGMKDPEGNEFDIN